MEVKYLEKNVKRIILHGQNSRPEAAIFNIF